LLALCATSNIVLLLLSCVRFATFLNILCC
jgi:hypothetical protein